MSFNPLALYQCLSGCDRFKVVLEVDAGKFCFAYCLQNLWFILMKKFATFGYFVGIFLIRKFKHISENLKLVSQRK